MPLNDCAEGNRETHQDQPEARPSFRKGREELLQPEPPRARRAYLAVRVAFTARERTPRKSGFSPTPSDVAIWEEVDWNLELNDAAAYSDGDRFGAVACPEFFHDVLDMSLDRLFGDEEESRNVAISISSGYLLKNIHLPLAQGFVTHMLREMGCDFGGNMLLSCVHFADRLYRVAAGAWS